jgi:NADH:ubiquinone oxidoreductase subunit 6 (subunit J)
MNQNKNEANNLHGMAQFVLFVSSYLPLFILIIVRQVSENSEYLHWTGISLIGIKLFIFKFGLSSILFLTSVIGLFGYWKTLGNIEEVAKNGNPITVKDVKNKNSEAIGYIATYIIPFLFQSFNGWFECLSVLFLMAIIYRIYINSSLLLINPLLSFKFAIYEIEYTENKKNKNGLIISRNKYLQDDANIKIYEIGHKLYFATNNN